MKLVRYNLANSYNFVFFFIALVLASTISLFYLKALYRDIIGMSLALVTQNYLHERIVLKTEQVKFCYSVTVRFSNTVAQGA